MDYTKPPPALKSIAMVCKCAQEHESRDIVITYYCRMYAVQYGMKIDGKSKESTKFLGGLLDSLDELKKTNKHDERITKEMLGHAHVEEYALKLFAFAFKKDEEGDFGSATIKSFLTAGILMDVLTLFGDVSEEIEKARKYAKFKAVYITRCQKNGEVPIAGPLSDGDASSVPTFQPSTETTKKSDPSLPHSPGEIIPAASPTSTNVAEVSLDTCEKATKAAKLAISCLQYKDTVTAVKYLTDALCLLNTKN